MDPTLDQDGDTIMTDAPPLSPPWMPPTDPWSSTRLDFNEVVPNARFNPPSVASPSPNEDNGQADSGQTDDDQTEGDKTYTEQRPRPRPPPRRLGISASMHRPGANTDAVQQSVSRRPRALGAAYSGMSRRSNDRSTTGPPGRCLPSNKQEERNLQKMTERMAERMANSQKEDGDEMLPSDYFSNGDFHSVSGVRPPPKQVEGRGEETKRDLF
ncbi:hypothetical protein ACHAPI_007089 [Fusarium lateritium]